MLSGISHDLRTPLTRMKLQIAFIKDKNYLINYQKILMKWKKCLMNILQFTSSSYHRKR